jgi:hypothetical protein
MPRKKTRARRTPDHQMLIFEIREWEPNYSFSLKRSGDSEEDYSEYAELHLDTVCVYPEPLSRRTATMIFSSRRSLFDHHNPHRDPSEKPDNVGLLNLPPSGGSFYGGLPHDSVPYLMSGLATERFRYVMISGPALKRGHSLSTAVHFARTPE